MIPRNKEFENENNATREQLEIFFALVTLFFHFQLRSVYKQLSPKDKQEHRDYIVSNM